MRRSSRETLDLDRWSLLEVVRWIETHFQAEATSRNIVSLCSSGISDERSFQACVKAALDSLKRQDPARALRYRREAHSTTSARIFDLEISGQSGAVVLEMKHVRTAKRAGQAVHDLDNQLSDVGASALGFIVITSYDKKEASARAALDDMEQIIGREIRLNTELRIGREFSTRARDEEGVGFLKGILVGNGDALWAIDPRFFKVSFWIELDGLSVPQLEYVFRACGAVPVASLGNNTIVFDVSDPGAFAEGILQLDRTADCENLAGDQVAQVAMEQLWHQAWERGR